MAGYCGWWEMARDYLHGETAGDFGVLSWKDGMWGGGWTIYIAIIYEVQEET